MRHDFRVASRFLRHGRRRRFFATRQLSVRNVDDVFRSFFGVERFSEFLGVGIDVEARGGALAPVVQDDGLLLGGPPADRLVIVPVEHRQRHDQDEA